MRFLDLVRRRYSCREYLSKMVPREALERCLEAARLAPSACNAQPWRFIVVMDQELKTRLAQKAFSGIFGMNHFAMRAPVLVAVVREPSKFIISLGGNFRGVQYSLIDLGIAVEHFVLQAEEEGLGTCWLGWFDEPGVKRILGLSHGEKVDILLSVGFPEDKPSDVKNRKSPMEIWEIR